MTSLGNGYNKNLKNKKARRFVNLRVFNFIIFILVFASSFIYLIGVSDLTVKSFALKELKQEQAFLEEKKLAYEQEINALQSYYVLSERAQSLDMVSISDIVYIKHPENVIALK